MTILTLKSSSLNYTRMHLSGIIPSRLSALTAHEIEQVEIAVDERTVPLGEWWHVNEVGGEHLRLMGDCSRCDDVGGEMDGGTLHVEGSVGDRLAHHMQSGTIIVDGHAGRFAGSTLRGGHVEIHGNVGEFAAAAPPGQSRGMRGGLFIVHGDCDRWLAARLRRGTVIALGNVAAGCGARMIAGTVVIAEQVEAPLGVGMRRGTILLLSALHAANEQLTPGFTPAEECELSYLPLLWNSIERYLPPSMSDAIRKKRTYRSLGDRAVRGLGECIWFDEWTNSHGDSQALIS